MVEESVPAFDPRLWIIAVRDHRIICGLHKAVDSLGAKHV